MKKRFVIACLVLIATGNFVVASTIDPNKKDAHGYTPVMNMIMQNPEGVKAYLEKTPTVNLDIKDNYGNAPLMMAADYPAALEALIDAIRAGKIRANINVLEPVSNETLAHKVNTPVALYKKIVTVPGINIEAMNATGQTPLQKAEQQEKESIVAALIAAGAKTPGFANAQEYKNNALFNAAAVGNTSALELWIKEGAQVDTDTRRGTALMEAARQGHVLAVKLLLEKGANINKKDTNSHATVFHNLLSQVPFFSLPDQYTKALQVVKELGAFAQKNKITLAINDADSQGVTPLLLAVRAEHEPLLQEILKVPGINVNAKVAGKTALAYARLINDPKKRTAIVEILQKAGAKE
jgi:ankyrin repeat protein